MFHMDLADQVHTVSEVPDHMDLEDLAHMDLEDQSHMDLEDQSHMDLAVHTDLEDLTYHHRECQDSKDQNQKEKMKDQNH
jgi:hypothetical protein